LGGYPCWAVPRNPSYPVCLSQISVDESNEIIVVSGALTSFVLRRISAANKATLESSADWGGEALRAELSVSNSNFSHTTIIIIVSSNRSKKNCLKIGHGNAHIKYHKNLPLARIQDAGLVSTVCDIVVTSLHSEQLRAVAKPCSCGSSLYTQGETLNTRLIALFNCTILTFP